MQTRKLCTIAKSKEEKAVPRPQRMIMPPAKNTAQGCSLEVRTSVSTLLFPHAGLKTNGLITALMGVSLTHTNTRGIDDATQIPETRAQADDRTPRFLQEEKKETLASNLSV